MPATDVFYVVLDSHADILIFEGLASAISGYEASEVIGKNWFEIFIPEQNLGEMHTVFDAFFNGDISFWKYKNAIACKDGTYKDIEWTNTLLRDKSNNPIKVICKGNLSQTDT